MRNSRRRVVSRPVVITVSSIPTRGGRTRSSRSAAAITARITVFQPTPNSRRIVLIGTLACDIATAARAAARDHTAPGATEEVRSEKVRSRRRRPAAACATAPGTRVPPPAGAAPYGSANRESDGPPSRHSAGTPGRLGATRHGDELAALVDVGV